MTSEPPDSAADQSGPDSGAAPPSAGGGRPSGLRNPAGAVRAMGAGTLVLEAIVLLLAIQPLRIFAGGFSGLAVGLVGALAVLAIVVAGLMKRPWAWHAGSALQVLLILGGLLHWTLAALGLIFGGAWAYATYVRRTILGTWL